MASPKNPASKEAKIKARKLRKCREELRNRLLAPIDVKELADDLLRILKRLPDSLPPKQQLATVLAQFLGQRWSVRSRVVEQLIERRAELLSDTFRKMEFEDRKALGLYFSKNPPEEKKLTPEEKARLASRRNPKNRYDQTRSFSSSAMGHIEYEFSEYRSDILFSLASVAGGEPPSGPCLDGILTGGYVHMVPGVYCLQDLFGMDRHRLPKALPCKEERSRERLYGLKGVMECMSRALGDERPEYRWLPDVERRKVVLTGIISRARKVGSIKVARAVEKILRPHLG